MREAASGPCSRPWDEEPHHNHSSLPPRARGGLDVTLPMKSSEQSSCFVTGAHCCC